MFRITRINCFLTLIFIIFFVAIFLKLIIKLFPLLIIAFLVYFLLRHNKKLIEAIISSFVGSQEYQSVPGKVYKQCSFCLKKADRSAKKCNNCGRSFE